MAYDFTKYSINFYLLFKTRQYYSKYLMSELKSKCIGVIFIYLGHLNLT